MKEKIDSLNGLKGMLCFIIAFLAHLHFPDTRFGSFISNQSWFYSRSVEIFCAISGFGMSIGYFDKINSMNFPIYIKKRVSKIFPLYWLTLTVCLIIQLVYFYFYHETSRGHFSLDLYHILFAYLGIECGWIIGAQSPNGPLWTIDCLLLCYIIYYLIVRLSKENKNYYIFSLFFLLFLSLTGIFKEWREPFLNYDNTLRCLGSFCIGALIKEIYTNRKWALRILFVELLSILYVAILKFVLRMNIYEAMGNRVSIAVIVFCPFMILSALYIKPFKLFLESRVMQWLGSISLSLYMWHIAGYSILYIFYPRFVENWIYVFAYICMQLILITLIHKFIELKILPKIRKLLID